MDSLSNQSSLQFNLKSLLLTLAVVCLFLAIWPTIALVILIISAFVALVIFVLYAVDRIWIGNSPGRPVPIGSFLLIATSTWAIMLSLGVSNFRIPVGNFWSMFVFNLSFGTLILMIVIPPLCAIRRGSIENGYYAPCWLVGVRNLHGTCELGATFCSSKIDSNVVQRVKPTLCPSLNSCALGGLNWLRNGPPSDREIVVLNESTTHCSTTPKSSSLPRTSGCMVGMVLVR